MEWINEGIEMDENEKIMPMCAMGFVATGIITCVATGALCDNLCVIQFG